MFGFIDVIRELCHAVPDMSIHGNLSSVHCCLDLDHYQLIRGLLEHNLGEPVEEFLRPYNLQDPSTYVRKHAPAHILWSTGRTCYCSGPLCSKFCLSCEIHHTDSTYTVISWLWLDCFLSNSYLKIAIFFANIVIIHTHIHIYKPHQLFLKFFRPKLQERFPHLTFNL